MTRALLHHGRRVRIVFLAMLMTGTSATDSQASEPSPPLVDATAFRDQLSVLTDGKGHYAALITFEYTKDGKNIGEHFFYGDGTHLFEQISQGKGSDGTKETLSAAFWAPRAHKTRRGALRRRDGQYSVHCGDRSTTFKPLNAAARESMLAKVQLFERKWRRRAYLLARDDEGVYYYVDRARTPADNFDFHLYTGHRGNMKQQPLINIVSDTEGDIFASKRGRLRLVHRSRQANRQESLEWFKGRTRKALTKVPTDLNAQLIYRDLGVYDGQRLGTPCDDL
jgi:hypothetical protein